MVLRKSPMDCRLWRCNGALFAPVILPLLFSCSDNHKTLPTVLETCSVTGETIVGVLSSITHARRVDGVVWGLNIDGFNVCNNRPKWLLQRRLDRPNGNPGIDNAFSALIPALESTEAVALESLVQDSINNGNLLLMVEITGVDNWQNDDCVDVSIWRGQGLR